MAENISSKQIDDINSAQAFSIACDDGGETALLCRYVNSDGSQEELIGLIPLKGQTWGQDICEAVVSCLEAKGINTTHLVSVSTCWSTQHERSTEGFCEFTSKVTGSRADDDSLHPPPGGYNETKNCCIQHSCIHRSKYA